MKSLEIVNRNIKAIKKLLYNLKDVQEGTREDFDKYYHEQELKEQQQIKQDLEVLEIIKNKKVDVDIIWILMKKHKDINDILWYYNFLCLREYRYLTQEELLKLKRWLEENENDN